METRRSFLKKAGILSGAAGMMHALPESLQRAFAINPAAGSSFYDAEHIVFLMQENRSFDHAFGTLQGVRGFNDPRAIRQPNNNKVWLQTNKEGQTYAPFPLDIKNSKITWMGSLPHSWTDQVDAMNKGDMNRWLDVKAPGKEEYKHMPLTMGYYSRVDIPFYYAMADAFTICDQHFCSSLTGTTPNRLFFWSGTIREKQQAASQAKVWNGDADYGGGEVHWKTYPERLEDHGISWKVYQNEIYSDVGLGDKQDWLDNFGDNPLEYFSQYNVRMSPEYIAYLPEHIRLIEADIVELEGKHKATADETEKKKIESTIASRKGRILELKKEQTIFTKENFEKLSAYHKSIHQKAFSTNRKNPDYHELTTLTYNDGTKNQEIEIPKGDILYQFREDVKNGKLPTVSWLAAPSNFSDHPSSPWFGVWYASEVLDILTQNPEVWKKTIFILTYDENDGYFDHVPPFAPPDPYTPNSGKVSPGIDTTVEYVRKAEQSSEKYNRESSIGLGFRVPMIIASPWTRGGRVCSEVFDHTSSIQFLEKFIALKTGKQIIDRNISAWRRTVCGNLTSAFSPYNNETIELPKFLDKEKLITDIHQAQFRSLPDSFSPLTAREISDVNQGFQKDIVPRQEKGVRQACALHYELSAACRFLKNSDKVELTLAARDNIFRFDSLGAPFRVYALKRGTKYLSSNRNYAVAAGDSIKDEWSIGNFKNNIYQLDVHGPNGFFCSFTGDKSDPLLTITIDLEFNNHFVSTPTGNLMIRLTNSQSKDIAVQVADKSYGSGSQTVTVKANEAKNVVIDTSKVSSWYDVLVTVKGYPHFGQRFAGHIEAGFPSKTDPVMGQVMQASLR